MRNPLESDKQVSLWPLVLFGVLVSWLARQTKTPHPKDNPDAASCYGKEVPTPVTHIVPSPPEHHKTKTTCRPDQTPWWKTLGEGIALFGGLGLLIVNIYQMRATEQSADTANKTMKLAYRPRVIINGLGYSTTPGFPTVFDKESRIEMSIGYSNVGTIMAKNVRYFIFWELVADKKEAKKLSYSETDGVFGYPKTSLPRLPNPESATFYTEPFTAEQVKRFRSPGTWVEFSVMITYDDDFGDTHHAEYCDMFDNRGTQAICPWPVQNE
jgi:hypothetical protein